MTTQNISQQPNGSSNLEFPNGNHKAGPILAVDFVEFWVGNAKVTSRYYCSTWGFTPISFRAIDKGTKRRHSHLIKQKDVTFIFTSTLSEDDEEFNSFLKSHGDAIKNVGIRVTGVESIFSQAVSHGARAIENPYESKSGESAITLATIAAPFGDVIHTLVDRSRYTDSSFLPHFVPVNSSFYNMSSLSGSGGQKGCGLTHIDHVTIAYHRGDMDKAIDWYINCLGFQHFLCNDDDNGDGLTIEGQESGLKTIPLTSSAEKYSFKMVFVEGKGVDQGEIKNQIEEFLEANGNCSGVQHLALHTKDMITTIDNLRNKGIEFIDVPDTYYENLFENEASFMKDSYNTLRDLGILLDISNKSQHNKEHPAFLMQTFTLPAQDRPTFFMEVICRKGSTGFGRRTIKALFEAVEAWQKERLAVAAESNK